MVPLFFGCQPSHQERPDPGRFHGVNQDSQHLAAVSLHHWEDHSAAQSHESAPLELHQQIAGTKEYIRLAHDLGVGGIKVRPNRVHDDQGIELEKTFAQIGQSLQECAVFASDWGVQVRLEVHGRITSDPTHMRAIMDHAPHPSACVCWNSNNTDVVGGSIDNSFALLGNRIGMVHITELWSEYPWRRLFSLLRDAGYNGYCLAEIAASSDSLRLMRYYRALWLALSGLEADA